MQRIIELPANYLPEASYLSRIIMKTNASIKEIKTWGLAVLFTSALLYAVFIAYARESGNELNNEVTVSSEHSSPRIVKGEISTLPGNETRTDYILQEEEVIALQQLNAELTRKVLFYESKITMLQQELSNHDPVNNCEDHSGYGGTPLLDAEDRQLPALTRNTDLIEREFFDEVSDPAWADTATDALIESFDASIDEAIELLDVECRSRSCRLEFAYDGDSWIDGLALIQELLPWHSELAVYDDDPESHESVVYIARDNYSLYSN